MGGQQEANGAMFGHTLSAKQHEERGRLRRLFHGYIKRMVGQGGRHVISGQSSLAK